MNTFQLINRIVDSAEDPDYKQRLGLFLSRHGRRLMGAKVQDEWFSRIRNEHRHAAAQRLQETIARLLEVTPLLSGRQVYELVGGNRAQTFAIVKKIKDAQVNGS
jgi:hypothetical protein